MENYKTTLYTTLTGKQYEISRRRSGSLPGGWLAIVHDPGVDVSGKMASEHFRFVDAATSWGVRSKARKLAESLAVEAAQVSDDDLVWEWTQAELAAVQGDDAATLDVVDRLASGEGESQGAQTPQDVYDELQAAWAKKRSNRYE